MNDILKNDLKEAASNMILEANELASKIRAAKIKELDLIKKQLENDFKDFVLIASKICETKNSSLMLIDDVYQYIKVFIGDNEENIPKISPKNDSICANTTIHSHDELTIIPDTKSDPRIAHTSWVKNSLIRFYAAAPLITTDGICIGSLCVFDDDEPRDLDEKQKEVLTALGRLIGNFLIKIK